MFMAEKIQAVQDLTGLLFGLDHVDQIRHDIVGKIRAQQHFEAVVDDGQVSVDAMEAVQYDSSPVASGFFFDLQ